RGRWAARRALISLAYLLLLDGHLGEAEGGHTQEETPEVLAVAVRDCVARLDGQAGATSERHERRERRDPGEEAHSQSPFGIRFVALRERISPLPGASLMSFVSFWCA